MKFLFNRNKWNAKFDVGILTLLEAIGWILLFPFIVTIGLPVILFEWLDCFDNNWELK